MKRKTGQSALEYIIVVVFALTVLSGLVYVFFTVKGDFTEDTEKAMIEKAGKEIIRVVEEAYYSSGAYRKTIKVDFPDSVTDVFVQDQQFIVIRTNTGKEFVFRSSAPLVSAVLPESFAAGSIVIERINGKVVLCTVAPCSCSGDEAANCNDLIDNDCDGLTDGADFPDCCTDLDNDSYADINMSVPACVQGGYATDCNSSRADINPGEQEMCDMIDHNCNGDLFDSACTLDFYVETVANIDGQPGCISGYEPMLSLSSYRNAEVYGPLNLSNTYGYDLCYKTLNASGVNLKCRVSDAGCSIAGHEKRVFGFYSGSHVETTTSLYPKSVCCNVSAVTGQFNCSTRLGGCTASESCVASVSSYTNAHIGECGSYPRDVCCRIE